MPSDRRPLRMLGAILATALMLRLVAIAGDTAFSMLATPDIAESHHERALALAQGWLDGRFAPLSELGPAERNTDLMRTLVAYALGPFYFVLSPITGSSLVPGRIAIAVYSLGLVPLVYALAQECYLSTRLALLAAAITVFWPGVVYRSVVIQREMIVALATLAIVWIAVQWAQSFDMDGGTVAIAANGGIGIAAGMVLFVIRPENLLIIIAVIVVATAVRYREDVRSLVATGVVVLVGGVVAVTNIEAFVGRLARKHGFSVSLFDSFAHARAHGDSAYLTWLHYESWLDIAVFAPLKVIYFLGSPLPWNVSGVSSLLAGISGWALIILTVLTGYNIAGAVRGDRERIAGGPDWRTVAVLITFLVVGITAYAIIEMNGGAAFRRRITFVPVLAILAAPVIAEVGSGETRAIW